MKNMLAMASAFTVCIAVLLVWMDRALANHLEKNVLPEMEVRATQTEKKLPEMQLPEVTIRPLPEQTATLGLPEVMVKAKRCAGA
ncbi:MAG: hypothetical protein L6Q97_06825 [Thermoanaerobaculia bacterium]|nr:hypothetical protein [Thermoanaerobaculia bacterium]